MSHLVKLQICGIRSFSPNHDDMQSIEFHHPLTVILGRNGAGKTTIIEACLNACTGQLPFSGAEKHSFIHDPRVAGEADVRAQIRFTFVAKNGKKMQCTRTYQASTSKSKTTFTTLDATLAYHEAGGKATSGTFRINDIDKILPDLLGVSRAVLEHVVFCHQEEGNWPLGQSSDVKKRLDDIFASSKYVAALEKFREAAKTYRAQVKQREATLLVLHEHCDQAQVLRKELADKEAEVQLIAQRSGDLDMRCAKLTRVLASLDAVSSRADGLQQHKDRYRGALEEKTKAAKDMRARRRATEPMRPLTDVKKALLSHDELVRTSAKEKKDTEAVIARLDTEKAKLTSEINVTESALGSLRDKELAHQRRVKELQQLIAKMAAKLRMELTALVGQSAMDEQGLVRFFEAFAAKVEELRSHRDASRAANEEQLRATDLIRETAAQRLSGATKEKQQKASRAVEAKGELQRVKAQHDAEASASADVDATTRDSDALRHTLEQRKQKASRSNTRHELQQTLSHIDEANKRSKALRGELDERTAERDVAARLGLLRHSQKEKQDALDATMKTKVWPQMKQLVGRTPEIGKLQKEVDTLRLSKDGARRNAEKACVEMEKRLAVQSQAVEEGTRTVATKDAFVASRTRELSDALGDAVVNFERAREDAEASAAAAIQQITLHETHLKIVEDQVAASKINALCDTCQRTLSKREQADFLETQSKKQTSLRSSIVSAKKVYAEKQTQLGLMRKLQGDVQDLTRVRDVELPPLRVLLEANEKQRVASAAALKDLRAASDVAAQDVAQVAEIAVDVTKVLALSGEIHGHATTITTLEKGAGVSASKRALDLVASEYDATQRRLQELNQGLVKLQGDAESEGRDIAGLEASLNAKLMDLERQSAARRRGQDLAARHESLKAEVAACEAAAQDLQRQADAAGREVADAARAVEEMRKAHRQAEAMAQETLDNFTREQEVLRASADGAKEHIALKVEEKISAATAQVADLNARHQKIVESAAQARDAFHKAARNVDEQQAVRRDLEDCLAVYTVEGEAAELAKKLKAVEDELGAVQQQHLAGVLEGVHQCGPSDTLWTVRDKCKGMMSELQQQIARNRGGVDHLTADINQHKDKLLKEKFADIEARMTSTQIKLRTAEIACTDIEKYHKALDKAVTQYHADKMRELNAIISHLWRSTYAGSDIDTIQIAFDEDLTNVTIKSRCFKYRVVMKKGDAEIDMRGRCSAGQKVLASVVIRLALSEAFCCDCGILVLDEPTTNLDEDNVLSLARALRVIIESRRQLRHFQLVVITHDEQFVRELGQSHAVESYYYIHKTMDGRYSLIDKVPIDRLFA